MELPKSNRFKVEPKNLFTYIGFVVLLTSFLFYIDEGHYSFAWTTEPGAWFVFALYSVVFIVCILLIDAFTYRNVKGYKKAITSISILFISLFLLMLLVTLPILYMVD